MKARAFNCLGSHTHISLARHHPRQNTPLRQRKRFLSCIFLFMKYVKKKGNSTASWKRAGQWQAFRTFRMVSREYYSAFHSLKFCATFPVKGSSQRRSSNRMISLVYGITIMLEEHRCDGNIDDGDAESLWQVVGEAATPLSLTFSLQPLFSSPRICFPCRMTCTCRAHMHQASPHSGLETPSTDSFLCCLLSLFRRYLLLEYPAFLQQCIG